MRRQVWLLSASLALLVALPTWVFALGTSKFGNDAVATGQNSSADREYERRIVHLSPPDLVLVNQDGDRARLGNILADGGPLVVDFIYATCTTICPILSAGFTNLQRRLGDDSSRIRLVSISIDPEHDTPEVMKQYLQRYRAKPGWDFLSGSRTDINSVMAGFDAYFPEKMSHRPLYFIRTSEPGKWVRIEGMIDGKSFMHEIEQAVKL